MNVVGSVPNDEAAGCFEVPNSNLQQLRDLCENEHNRGPDVETSTLIRKLQRTVAERCADLSRTRDALHLAQHQVSSLQSEIHSIEASIQQQQINQLSRIKVAKSRLLRICGADDALYDGTTTSTIASNDATRSHCRENHDVSLTNGASGDYCQNGASVSFFHTPMFEKKHSVTPTVGPVVFGRPIAAPVGPVRGLHRQIDIVRSENNSSNQDNSDQYACKSINNSVNPSASQPVSQPESQSANQFNEDECVKILDIHPDGKYIRLRNASRNQNYNLGQCRLQQEIAGHPVAIFRFPSETTLLYLDNVTVWAEGCLPTGGTSEPTDLIFRGLQKWGAGPHFTTLLFSHRGQILSRWSAVHRPSAVIPFQSTIQIQRPPYGCRPRVSSSALASILSKSLHAEEMGKVFHRRKADECHVHTGAVSQLQRPYSAVSLPSRLQKI